MINGKHILLVQNRGWYLLSEQPKSSHSPVFAPQVALFSQWSHFLEQSSPKYPGLHPIRKQLKNIFKHCLLTLLLLQIQIQKEGYLYQSTISCSKCIIHIA